jgi:hypothetical protein
LRKPQVSRIFSGIGAIAASWRTDGQWPWRLHGIFVEKGADAMQHGQIRTDWLALLLSLSMPAVIVGGLIDAALQPSGGAESSEWLEPIFALAIVESARAMALFIAQTTYENCASPWQAMKFFLAAIAVLVVFVVVGAHPLEVVASHAWMVPMVLLPVAVIIADTLLGLLLFRGDARAQAARVDAMATTSASWLMLAVWIPLFGFPLLILFAKSYANILQANLRPVSLIYVAAYFAGKAILLAYLHSSRFQRTGRCLFPREKQKVIDARRAALLGANAVA